MRRRHPGITLSAGAALIGIAASCARAPDAVTDADRLPPLRVEEELRIGSVDDPDAGFSAISAVAVDDDGLVYVLERVDRHVRVYDAEGTRLRTLGRAGSGPGEFRSVVAVGVHGDTVWVTDAGQRRITLFRRDGDLIGTVTAVPVELEPVPGVILQLFPGTLRADGYYESGFAVLIPDDPPADTLQVPRVRMNARGEIIDTIGFQPFTFRRVVRLSDGGPPVTVPPVPSSTTLELPVGDGQYAVRRPVAADPARARFTVARIGADGDTSFDHTFRYRPRAPDAAFVDTLILPHARRYAAVGLDVDAVEAALRAAIELPGFLPPISSGRVMADSSLWLLREYDPDAGTRWIVLEPDGSVRGALELPRAATVHWSRGDVLWTVVRDEFDVQWLVRYRIRPGARD